MGLGFGFKVFKLAEKVLVLRVNGFRDLGLRIGLTKPNSNLDKNNNNNNT